MLDCWSEVANNLDRGQSLTTTSGGHNWQRISLDFWCDFADKSVVDYVHHWCNQQPKVCVHRILILRGSLKKLPYSIYRIIFLYINTKLDLFFNIKNIRSISKSWGFLYTDFCAWVRYTHIPHSRSGRINSALKETPPQRHRRAR